MSEELSGIRYVGQEEIIAQCPFHNEKTSSFRVNAKRYHCFGCGEHGDIISWTAHKNNCSMGEAIRLLGGNCIVRNNNPVNKPPPFSEYDAIEANKIIEINKWWMNAYVSHKHVADSVAFEYMKGRFSVDLLDKFDIGYAPPTGIVVHRFENEDLLKASLIAQDSRGRYYDRLRDRIVFPLLNREGRCLGFAGRLIPRTPNSNIPKYINPANTKCFNRKSYLYGWQSITDAKSVILVEGYMDILSLYSAGIRNILSCMGTAITAEQVNQLSHITNKVFIMLDGDMPGLKALKAIHDKGFFKDSGIDVSCILLTDNEDPDSFVNKDLSTASQRLRSRPIIKLSDFDNKVLTVKIGKHSEYDRSLLDKAAQKYVDSNRAEGLGHYNVVDWVISAYPQYANEIRQALVKLRDDYVYLPDGNKGFKEENVRKFLIAWMKPCRDVRKEGQLKKKYG